MKATQIFWKDEGNKSCYNALGDKFALPDYLSTTEVPFFATVSDRMVTIAVTEEIAPDEVIEYTVAVPTIVGAFKTIDELVKSEVDRIRTEELNEQWEEMMQQHDE